MILTVALNPAIDKTYTIESFAINSINRTKQRKINVGGKGINAAKVIKILQGEPLVAGFLGGLNGKYIKSNLDKTKIRSDFTWVNGETRINTKIIDPVGGTQTDINDNGMEIQPRELVQMNYKIKMLMKQSKVLLLAGSIPMGIEPDIYYTMIEDAKKCNCKTILAAEGEALKRGIEAIPYGVKLQKLQLKELGMSTESIEKMTEDAMKLVQKGIHYVAIDLGKEGGLVLSKGKICYVESFEIEPLKLVGASDAFLGAFAVGVERKYEQEKFSKLAVAASFSTMICDTDEICKKSDIDTLVKKVKVRELANRSQGMIKNKYIRIKKLI